MKIKAKSVKLAVSLPEVVAKLNDGFDRIGRVVVGRSETLEAIKLAIVSRNHVLLDGEPGVAKSLIADSVFSLFYQDNEEESKKTALVFSKQFMAGTMPDEIFGPMNSKKYREEAIWQHNTDRMMPSSHFAFLDEVFRASDTLLPSMLGVLNERRFFNGTVAVKCPLMTAIGTCNFISDTAMLEAFVDRWMIVTKVAPLSDPSSRRKAMRSFVEGTTVTHQEKVSISELKALHDALSEVEVPDTVLALLEDTVSKVGKQTSGVKVSDRRLCHMVRLVQAGALLSSDGDEEQITADESHVMSAAYGLNSPNNRTPADLFLSHVEKEVGDMTRMKAEIPQLEEFTKTVEKLYIKYDSDMSKAWKVKLLDLVETIHAAEGEESPSDKFTSPKLQARYAASKNRLEELRTTLVSAVGIGGPTKQDSNLGAADPDGDESTWDNPRVAPTKLTKKGTLGSMDLSALMKGTK